MITQNNIPSQSTSLKNIPMPSNAMDTHSFISSNSIESPLCNIPTILVPQFASKMESFIKSVTPSSGLLISKPSPNSQDYTPLGSGNLINNHHTFLTARHCYDQQDPSSLYVRFFSYKGIESGQILYSYTDIKVVKAYNAADGLDAGILALAPHNDEQLMKCTTSLKTESEFFPGGNYTMVHFSGGRHQQISTGTPCSNGTQESLKHSLFIDGGPGSSGAGIINDNGEIVGINIYRRLTDGSIQRDVIKISDMTFLTTQQKTTGSFFPDPIRNPYHLDLLPPLPPPSPHDGPEVYKTTKRADQRKKIGNRMVFYRKLCEDELNKLKEAPHDPRSLLQTDTQIKWFSTSETFADAFHNGNVDPSSSEYVIRMSFEETQLGNILGEVGPAYKQGAYDLSSKFNSLMHQETMATAPFATTDSSEAVNKILRRKEHFNVGLKPVQVNELRRYLLKTSVKPAPTNNSNHSNVQDPWTILYDAKQPAPSTIQEGSKKDQKNKKQNKIQKKKQDKIQKKN